MVFNPPPQALVSLTPTVVCPTTASVPSQPVMMDRRSNPDSGYGSKIYCSRGAGPAVDPVPSGQEFHLVSPIKTDVIQQSRVCSSFPDVVVDRPLYRSRQVSAAAALPQTVYEHAESSGRQRCRGDAGSLSADLDLRTYSETNLVVSPHRGRSRVPIALADENSAVDVGEVFSPTSPLSLDSVDFITEKVSDCMLSSPTDNVPNTDLPLGAVSYRDVLQKTRHSSTTDHNEQLCYNVNSVAVARNEHLVSRSLGIITEDVGQTSRDCESYRKTVNCSRSPTSTVSIFGEHATGRVESAEMMEDAVHRQMVRAAAARSLPIGRSTTV